MTTTTRPPQRWSLLSQILHWGMALLMLLVVALGLIGDALPVSGEKITVFVYHKSVGILILAFVLIRIFWRWSHSRLVRTESILTIERKLSTWVHLTLYTLLLALPLSGWLLNSAAGYPFKWMDLFAFPSIPGASASQTDLFSDLHHYLFYGMVVVVIGHIGAALFHHFKLKDSVLANMLPEPSRRFWLALCSAFAVFTAFILFRILLPHNTSITPVNASPETISEYSNERRTQAKHTDLEWFVISEKSTLRFTNHYDGNVFDGEFSAFNASLFFDQDAIETGFFDVNIDTASATTGTADWDSSLPGEEWFNSALFSNARYVATSFSRGGSDNGHHYVALGTLSLKGVSKVIPLNFSWLEQPDGHIQLLGHARVNRTDFGVGSGIWKNDPTIGFDVDIHVELLLTNNSENALHN